MKKIEVLIIEDNLKVAKAHQLYVEKVEGFSVTGVVNSLEDAEGMVAALEPDLVLLDVYFPDGNGMDLLGRLRANHTDCDVILITAAKEVKLLHNALRGGVFDYLIKPVFFERFEEALLKYRRHRQNLGALERVDQEGLDRYFGHAAAPAGRSEIETPKGIDPLTLEKVVEAFDRAPQQGMNAEEVGQLMGASRTTARKYLEYLISTGYLRIDLVYGTIGRPERKYFRA